MAVWQDWFRYRTTTDFPKPDGPDLWAGGRQEHVPNLSGGPYMGAQVVLVDAAYQPKPLSRCTYCGTPWREDGNGRCRSCGGYGAVERS